MLITVIWKKIMANQYILLGPPRSGMNLLAGWLSLMGLKRAMPATQLSEDSYQLSVNSYQSIVYSYQDTGDSY